jgi:aspartyl-tRNA synthetase
MEIIKSQCDPELRFKLVYVEIKDITEEHAGKEIRIRGRVGQSRGKGKMCFLQMREGYATVQALVRVEEGKVSKGMCDYASKIPNESIVEIVADCIKPDEPISGCSQQVELHVKEIRCVNKSVPVLPFQIADASRKVLDQAAEDGGAKAKVENEEEKEDKEDKQPVVKQDVRLDNRVIDLRVPTNQAIFRLQSGVCQIYREFMIDNDFVEIHSPKLIGGSSEGGANVFKFKYFEQDGCLAQSPQLYKQMAITGGFPRVFEIGPVFRAENSNTNRHLCEFTGLDMEMEFKNHYFEVLDFIGKMLVYLFQNVKTRFARELNVIGEQYPFEEFKCADPVVKLNFREGVKMLKEAGIEQDELEDLSTETEKALGRIVKEKYDTDFYMLYGYPVSARPFYTMLDPHDSRFTNSYDFFMRGEEITSGAQRIHDPVMLEQRAKECGLAVETIKDYIGAFKYGAPCHAGAGFGLERIVKFYCNLHNIRKASLFPRDPKRLAP